MAGCGESRMGDTSVTTSRAVLACLLMIGPAAAAEPDEATPTQPITEEVHLLNGFDHDMEDLLQRELAGTADGVFVNLEWVLRLVLQVWNEQCHQVAEKVPEVANLCEVATPISLEFRHGLACSIYVWDVNGLRLCTIPGIGPEFTYQIGDPPPEFPRSPRIAVGRLFIVFGV